ncbi:GNAT family N-acetyltransferase [Polaribacter sp. R77954]|uniref:GNAT family N-acetyltransferase n=1 Tax=Polaribacter sp. R77954 TaxID=3093870 RepID=UPI0037C85413
MISLEDKLKNPVWYSLKETHKKFSVNFDGVKFYNPEVLTFGAFLDNSKTEFATNEFINTTENFFLVSSNNTPIPKSTKVVFKKKINGCQMVLQNLNSFDITENIVLLTKAHLEEIYDLIWLVMPGYYQKRSFELGDFYGIFKDNQLVAVTGQRMQTHSFIEVSAVVTHPEYTKRGFAKQLVTHTTQQILNQNKLPILHTNKGNPAIQLYEKLGFKITRDMNWWLYAKK